MRVLISTFGTRGDIQPAIALGQGLIALILIPQQRRVDSMCRAAGSAWQDWNLVFPSPVGSPLRGKTVTNQLRCKLAEAGLPRVRFHDLRHTCATLFLDNGIHERVTMEQLGHSQISLTLNTYSHVRPAMLSAAASALDRALGSTDPDTSVIV
jgi:integrase